MKSSFKRKLMTLSLLSVGFAFYTPEVVLASFKAPETKAYVKDTSFSQYPLLGDIKSELNIALDLHKTAVSLVTEKQFIESYKEIIEKYEEIVSRLAQNESCNKSLLAEHFSDSDAVWEKVSAWAEDSASTLLAESSDSFGSTSDPTAGTEDVAVSADMSEDQLLNQVVVVDEEDIPTEGLDMDEATAFGKVRWDIGNAVLTDIYANPESWGSVKKDFSPWVDQTYAYTVYINNRYSEYKEAYKTANSLGPFYNELIDPLFETAPAAKSTDSFVPKDYEGSGVATSVPTAFSYKIAEDDVWNTSSSATCERIGAGRLFSEHNSYIAAVNVNIAEHNVKYNTSENPEMYLPPIEIDMPCMPMTVLPPWREAAYLMTVEKEIPQIASDVPEPWQKVVKNIDYFSSSGELSNLVEKYKIGTSSYSLRYRPEDYEAETGEIKTDPDGTARIPLPLMTNRISSYLALFSEEETELPNKEKAVASMQEMNENVISVMSTAGYDMPNADSFDLTNEEDYAMALEKLEELQKAKTASATAKIQALRAEFGGDLLASILQMIAEEETAIAALEKDTEFLVDISRDNADEINSLLITAIADVTATQTYKDNLEDQLEDLATVSPVGCPVL